MQSGYKKSTLWLHDIFVQIQDDLSPKTTSSPWWNMAATSWYDDNETQIQFTNRMALEDDDLLYILEWPSQSIHPIKNL